jgi:hypothetical protein
MTDGDVYVVSAMQARSRERPTTRDVARADRRVLQFLLQLSVLSWVQRPKAQDLAVPKPEAGPAAAAPVKKAEAPAASSKSDWMSLGGLADMVRDVSGSSKAARFPEKLLKRLGERLERIAMGRDPHYNDQSLRQTIGVFYGTYKETSFQKQMRENRKVEELILIFVTAAQKALRARTEGDAWKEELNKQVSQFVKIIRECLRALHGVPKELTERLDGYSAKLTPAPISLSQQQREAAQASESSAAATASAKVANRASNGNLMDAPSSSSGVPGSRRASAASSAHTLASPLLESEMIRTVGQLFQVDAEQLQRDVEFMLATATEKVSHEQMLQHAEGTRRIGVLQGPCEPRQLHEAERAALSQAAMIDLKRCVRNINLQAAWPARRDDFDSEEAYQTWRAQELQNLSSIMAQMCKAKPELLRTTNSRDDDLSVAAAAQPSAGEGSTPAGDGAAAAAEKGGDAADSAAEDDEAALAGFTFIPPDPKAYYRRALELCIDHDLEQIKYQPEEEEVSLSILSRAHVELLSECALRWRLMSPFRSLANLEVVQRKHDAGEVPLDCITEALNATQLVIDESGIETWAVADRALLVRIYSALFVSFLRYITDAFQDIQNVEPSEVQPYLDLVTDLHGSGLVREGGRLELEPVELDRYVEDLKDRIRIMAIHDYTAKTTDLFSQIVENEVQPLLQLLDWLEKGAKRVDKRFPEPVLGSVDPVALLLEKQVSLYLDDLDSMRQQIVAHAARERDPLPFEDVLHLYNRVKALLRMHSTFCPHVELVFDLCAWFEPHIRQWLALTEKKTGEWVHNAVSTDRFVPIESEGAVHSSSIDDLFGALQQPLDFIQSLNWSDPYRNARFLTSLAKTISRSIEQYCNRVEELFMEEMFPRTAEDQDASQKQSAWMIKAKQTLQGEKRVEPFHFQTSVSSRAASTTVTV